MIWAGPSNSGLIEPAQCTLIALDAINVQLLTMIINDYIEDDDIRSHAVAFVRTQTVSLLGEYAIEDFHTTHRKQVQQEHDLRQEIARVADLLAQEPHLSERELADALGVDVDDLIETLDKGAQRHLLTVQRRYRPHTETEPDPGGSPDLSSS